MRSWQWVRRGGDDRRITAVIAHAYVQAGAFHEISEFIPLLYIMTADQVFPLFLLRGAASPASVLSPHCN